MTKTQLKRYLKNKGAHAALYDNFEFKFAADAEEAFDVMDSKLRQIIDAKSKENYPITWDEIEHNIDIYEEIEYKLFGRVR